MGSSFKVLAFLLLSNILSISTATRPIETKCGSCTNPPVIPVLPIVPVTPTVPVLPGVVPPVTVPNLPVPPVTVTVPPVIGVVPLPPVTVPPITVPLVPVIGILPVPPVSIPNLPLPPVVANTPKKGKPCDPPANKKATCPVNTLKLGACASALGGTVSIVMGDPAVNKCCPIISGLMDVEAAACLCTTLKINILDIKMHVPMALQLLVTCGKTPPPGFTCAI